jgi:hypothetical protein
MKLLVLKDYLASRQQEVGINSNTERKLVLETIDYIASLCETVRVQPDIMLTAITILHYHLKHRAFTEIDRFLAATACVYLACKIDYKHLAMQNVIEYLFNNRKGFMNKKNRRSDIEIFAALQIEISKQEIELLSQIEFDLEFDLPCQYLTTFRLQYSTILKL